MPDALPSGCGLAALATDLGVDSLSLGATENGLLFGEAVVVFDPVVAERLGYYRKQLGQLHSKMRFVAAQFEALFRDDLWLENARHANAVFVRGSEPTLETLRSRYVFSLWDPRRGIARLMTAFDTTADEVDELVEWLGEAVAERGGAGGWAR